MRRLILLLSLFPVAACGGQSDGAGGPALIGLDAVFSDTAEHSDAADQAPDVPDPCEGVVCEHGACQAGTCACEVSWIGERYDSCTPPLVRQWRPATGLCIPSGIVELTARALPEPGTHFRVRSTDFPEEGLIWEADLRATPL